MTDAAAGRIPQCFPKMWAWRSGAFSSWSPARQESSLVPLGYDVVAITLVVIVTPKRDVP
jgi:hypothetical protein